MCGSVKHFWDHVQLSQQNWKCSNVLHVLPTGCSDVCAAGQGRVWVRSFFCFFHTSVCTCAMNRWCCVPCNSAWEYSSWLMLKTLLFRTCDKDSAMQRSMQATCASGRSMQCRMLMPLNTALQTQRCSPNMARVSSLSLPMELDLLRAAQL